MSESPRQGSDRGHSEHNSAERGRSEDRDKRDKGPSNYTQVYVAKLHRNTKQSDIEEAFSKFGKIREIVQKHAYAFIDYDDHEAAEKAIQEMNNKAFVNGEELVVE